MILRHVGIQDAKVPDDAAAGVGEQGVGDAVAIGKALQDVWWIGTDGEDGDVVLLEGFQVPVQLDQLRLTESSPGRASVEEDDGLSVSPDLGVVDRVAELVGEREVGDGFADLGSLWEVFGEGVASVDELWSCHIGSD